MSSSYHAALLALLIVALAANAYRRHRGGRPMTEHLVDALYSIGLWTSATALAADEALREFREVVRDSKAETRKRYTEAPCSR